MPPESMNATRRRRTAGLLLLLLAVGPAALTAQDSALTRSATVTYIAGGSIYVAAGRDDGLAEGQELSVTRGDSVIATLKVAFLSSRQASCEVVRASGAIVVGDTVHFTPAATPPAPTLAEAPQPAPRRLAGSRGPGLHGRIGLRYLVAREDPGGTGFRQPSADLRLQASELGGVPLGIAVDLRTRRTTRDRSSGAAVVDGRTRVYQAALLWRQPGAPFRVVLGRQYLTAVTSVSLFDGVLAELHGKTVSGGVFAGIEPEPARLEVSTEVQDFGGYVQLHGQPGGATRWHLTSGVVGSYQNGTANREFLYAQASLQTPTVSLNALQEVDYYRPWKVDQGESSFSPTSAYLSAAVRPARWLAFRGSYDTRRRVRLYRDAIDPATAFDDSYRKGASGGVTIGSRRIRLSGDLHRSTSDASGTATAYTGTLGLDRVTPLHAGFTIRTTHYSNASTSGHLETLRLGLAPTPALRLDWSLGSRSEKDPLADPTRRRFIWYGLDADLGIGRAWYLSFSGQRESGAGSTTTLLYSSLTWRF